MAKSITSEKRENEKKRQARRVEKLKKKESRKLAGKAGSFDDMIAYVDENGMITSTPPGARMKKGEIKQEEIAISIPKRSDEPSVVLKGRVEFYNSSKGYGFIKNLAGTDKYFFHVNQVTFGIAERDIVTFDLERGPRGMNAVNVCLAENK